MESPAFTRTNRLAAFLVLGAGAAALIGAALAGRYFVVSKGVLVVLLLLAGTLSGRVKVFLREWLLFLVLLLLFDALRGAIYVWIFDWGLPWYMGYAIEAERLIFGVPSMPHWFAGNFPELMRPGVVRSVMVLIHASHFVYFFGFGYLVFRLRPEAFTRLKAAMLLAMFTGLLGYLLIPTVPPWMAASFFDVLPPIDRVLDQVYNTYVPRLFVGFQVNLIAAMPSLHAAFPTVCAASACRLFGWRAWPFLIYTCLTYISPVYLGEHYAVDLLGGALLGLACYLVAFHSGLFSEVTPSPPIETGMIRYVGARRLFLCMLVFSIATVLGAINRGTRYPELLPDSKFIARELRGKSPLAPFFEGALALSKGRTEEARPLLAEGLATPAAAREDFSGYILLLRAASKAQALPLLVDLLEAIPRAQRTRLCRYALKEARWREALE